MRDILYHARKRLEDDKYQEDLEYNGVLKHTDTPRLTSGGVREQHHTSLVKSKEVAFMFKIDPGQHRPTKGLAMS